MFLSEVDDSKGIFEQASRIKWEPRMVYYDITKNALGALFYKPVDWLIIDLIDERFGMIKTELGQLTYSQVLTRWDKFEALKEKERYNIVDNTEAFEIAYRNYCNYLKYMMPENQIIINEVYPSYLYKNREGKIQIFEGQDLKIHNMIKRLEVGYNLLKKYLPKAHYITSSRNVIGWEKHKWGLSYVHFEDSYYDNTITKITEIIKNTCK